MSVPDLLFGSTPAMVRVLDFCARFARTDYPIVIAGPPGSGKTVLARYIHELSGRTGDFLVCSLANVPRGLGESHLHGHRRGVFTGAYTDQRGMIEAAHQGTLFLEEIGLASDHSQGLLLDLFDNAPPRRVGDTRGPPVDLRTVAATNAGL